MASSIFQTNNNQSRLSQLMNFAKSIKNPEEMYRQMYQNNPQFKQFIDDNKGLSNEQIAQKYGIKL